MSARSPPGTGRVRGYCSCWTAACAAARPCRSARPTCARAAHCSGSAARRPTPREIQAKKKSTKTAAGERLVPMPPDLLARLDQSGRYFVHGRDGKMLTLTHLRRMGPASTVPATVSRRKSSTAIRSLSTPSIPRSLHIFCATLTATNLRRQGYDLKTAQYLMGQRQHHHHRKYLQPCRRRGYCQPGAVHRTEKCLMICNDFATHSSIFIVLHLFYLRNRKQQKRADFKTYRLYKPKK